MDALIPEPIFASTHAITIDAPPQQVWPWIAQMGAGRAGWYSWDAIDNGGVPSRTGIVPDLQSIVRGDILPAVPGAGEPLRGCASPHDQPRPAAVTVFLMFLAIGFGATAFGKRFRAYSIVTIVVLLVFGGLTFLEAPRLQMSLPTPWIGLWERINISVFLLWIVTLAAMLWRPRRAQGETP